MAQYSTRRFHSHSTHCAMVLRNQVRSRSVDHRQLYTVESRVILLRRSSSFGFALFALSPLATLSLRLKSSRFMSFLRVRLSFPFRCLGAASNVE